MAVMTGGHSNSQMSSGIQAAFEQTSVNFTASTNDTPNSQGVVVSGRVDPGIASHE